MNCSGCNKKLDIREHMDTWMYCPCTYNNDEKLGRTWCIHCIEKHMNVHALMHDVGDHTIAMFEEHLRELQWNWEKYGKASN